MKQILLSIIVSMTCAVAIAQHGPQVKVESGIIEGIDSSGVCIFRGIPFAAPPVGELRWKAPQPVVAWQGVREAKKLGHDPMQYNAFGDMVFEGNGQSEDCLYLNVWTPAKLNSQTSNPNSQFDKLPVLIYFNGGGLVSGSGSEPRYQGLRLARRGIIVVTANYREGIFGFFSHPQLTKEGGCNGNQGWLDQAAAIKWVKNNIAAFGGDPDRITINGESAGSQSVCAQTVSPLSKDLIAGYMCSSGSIVSNASPISLKESEKIGEEWAKKNGFKKLTDLRKLTAEELLKLETPAFGEGTKCIDGIFLNEDPNKVIAEGRQAQVPCLLGSNNAEMPLYAFGGGLDATLEKAAPMVSVTFGVDANTIYELYGIHSNNDIFKLQGYQLGGDMFIVYATWKWADMVRQSSHKPVYRYVYCHPRPDIQLEGKAAGLAGGTVDVAPNAPKIPSNPGAVHSADIEYAMGNLSTNSAFSWKADDYAVSEIFQQMYVNFVKTGNPNGLGLPQWDAYNSDGEVPPTMFIDVKSEQKRPSDLEARYHKIDGFIQSQLQK
ncbi:MAG TPA: carboxylesterase [Prevotella sp.]|nr:carboxylesterase [Prevotella sp.]